MMNSMLRAMLVIAMGIAVAIVSESAAAAGEQERRDVLYGPTPYEVIDAMLDLGEVHAGDMLYDLGSGDGRIVIRAAEQRGTRGVGVEIDPDWIRKSRRNAQCENVAQLVDIVEGDLFAADLSSATVVTLFLNPRTNLKLRDKLLRELRPGARVLSHKYDMGDWKPDKTIRVGQRVIYRWTVPALFDGNWRMTIAGGLMGERHILRLRQKYQSAEGTMSSPDDWRLRDIAVQGSDVYFDVERTLGGKAVRQHFKGRIDGDRIRGVMYYLRNGRTVRRAWSAERLSSEGVHREM